MTDTQCDSGYRLYLHAPRRVDKLALRLRIGLEAERRGMVIEEHAVPSIPEPWWESPIDLTVTLSRYDSAAQLIADAATITRLMDGYERNAVIPSRGHIASGVHWDFILDRDHGHSLSWDEARAHTVPRRYLDPNVMTTEVPGTPKLNLTLAVRRELGVPTARNLGTDPDREDRVYGAVARVRFAALHGRHLPPARLRELLADARSPLVASARRGTPEARARILGGQVLWWLATGNPDDALQCARRFAVDATSDQRRQLAETLGYMSFLPGALGVPSPVLRELAVVASQHASTLG